MTLSDLAAIGSLVSGIAVVVTLIFLLFQMRQTNRNQRSLMQQGRTARITDIFLRQTDLGLSATVTRAMLVDMTLDRAEAHTVNVLGAALFWSFGDSFLQHKSGLLDEESWKQELSSLRTQLALPHMRVVWKLHRSHLTGAYRAFVDALIQEIKPRKGFDEYEVWKSMMAKELADAG
jgi:hypothetical protein